MSETPLKRAKMVISARFSGVPLLARRLRAGRVNHAVDQFATRLADPPMLPNPYNIRRAITA
jgi:hypothetical protein